MQPGREMGERGRRLGEWWAILQSNISFAINPIWIDFPPSHALRNSAQMLFFYGVSKWQVAERDTECGRGEEGANDRDGGKETQKGRSWSSASLWLLSWGYSEQLLSGTFKEADYRQSQTAKQTDGPGSRYHSAVSSYHHTEQRRYQRGCSRLLQQVWSVHIPSFANTPGVLTWWKLLLRSL